GVMDRREVLVQSYREEGRRGGRAFFRVLFYVGLVLLFAFHRATPTGKRSSAVWPYDELDIGRGDSCRAFVHLVGAFSPRRSLVRPGGDEGWSPGGRHRALWARAPSDLFGPNLWCRGNSAPEKNRRRAACRRRCDHGLKRQSATGGTLPPQRIGR